MKICHVTSVHSWNDDRIFWKECLSLSKKYEVSLIAPNTNDREEQGIRIYGVELPAGRFIRQKYLGRVLDKMIEVNADIYHLHDPELMRLGNKIRKIGKKIIFDSHEDVPMQILGKEYLPNWSKKTISWIYSCIEKRLLRNYDSLVTVTPTIADRLSKINPHTYMVTNYPVWNEYSPSSNNTMKYVCFAGGVSRQYMHENIIRGLRKTEARYLLAGPAYPGYIDKLRSLEGWKQVEYLGIINHNDVYDIYKKSIAGIVLLDYMPNVGYHRGSLGVIKLFEMMMAGLPVIATDFELWKDIVEGCDCGICIDPHNIDAIAEAINYLVSNPEIAKQKGANGRKAVGLKYNWSTQEKLLFDIYEKLEKA